MSDLESLREAMTKHGATKHPRWARLADWASARLEKSEPRDALDGSAKQAAAVRWLSVEGEADPLDVPRLFAAFHGGVRSPVAAARVKRLALRKDPRVVSGLLALLEAPPFRAGTALPFFRACLDALVASKDVRARVGLESLASRYKSIVDSSIGEVIAGHCARAAAKLAAVTEPELSADDERRLGELERNFEVERRSSEATTREASRAKQSDDDLLSAIYANPDDDGPRLVFADTLSERGDVRGEFITLQVRRAAGQGTLEALAREQELHSDSKRRAAWSLPLSSAGDCTFRRGFPSGVMLTARNTKAVVGVPAWATVRSLALPNGVSGKTLRALVDHPEMARLVRVTNLTADNRGLLGEAVRRWREVAMDFRYDEAVPEGLADQFPDVTALTLRTAGPVTATALSRFTKVEALNLALPWAFKDLDWLLTLPKLTHLRLTGVPLQSLAPGLLARLRLKTLGAHLPEAADRLEGVSVDVLDLGNSRGDTVARACSAVERVRKLSLSSSYPAPLVKAALPVWTAKQGLELVRLNRHQSLERHGAGWVLHSEFATLQLDRGKHGGEDVGLVGLAAVPGIEKVVLEPLHPTPLSRASPPPTDEELGVLTAAWGARLEQVNVNPRLLALSLEVDPLA
ncbi:MAG: TIGR02996 domain-containing protein [Myxococcaceae bacterium]|nr:TIGR02996 domain-containing protein [Myxococcaceae bacterium]